MASSPVDEMPGQDDWITIEVLNSPELLERCAKQLAKARPGQYDTRITELDEDGFALEVRHRD